MGLQTAHIYWTTYKKLKFEQTQINVRTNKLSNAIERVRERETKLFHGFEPDRLGLGQTLDELSGTSKQISFEERHGFADLCLPGTVHYLGFLCLCFLGLRNLYMGWTQEKFKNMYGLDSKSTRLCFFFFFWLYVRWKYHFRLYIFTLFSLWSLLFTFTFLVPILKTCSILVPTVISLTEISYVANRLHY